MSIPRRRTVRYTLKIIDGRKVPVIHSFANLRIHKETKYCDKNNVHSLGLQHFAVYVSQLFSDWQSRYPELVKELKR